ncbi:MAG: ornithine cyclodeaminase family protein [Actinomycetota bacterium]|nr:ornithine cyclodeaminase family protein [Actinomycetota bacterium]
MALLILNQREVEELLDVEGCIGAMEEALAALARDEVHLPLRPIVRPPGEDSFMGLMPVHRGGGRPQYALKTICVFPDNPQRGLDPHQGFVSLHDGETGQLRVLVNASAVTAIRTAAVSALATRTLARAEARVCAIVGAGHQGRAHVQAMRALPFERILVASRTPEHARGLAAESGAEAVASVEEAVRAADVVCTVTSSAEPVLRREWLQTGAHVNAVGAGFPHTRELDTATVAAAAFFVDRRESAENEAGDYLIPLREGAIGEGHIRAELGEVLIGAARGRKSNDELTVFESLGLAVEDLAAAEYLARRARETGAGTEVDF